MTYQESAYVQAGVSKGLYDLNVGQPSPDFLPLSLFNSAVKNPITDPLFLQYATPQGYPAFREELASFLSEETGGNVTAAELLLTGGNSSAIHLIGTFIASAHFKKHKTRPLALVESPTYQWAVWVLEACGFETRKISVDKDGMVIKEVETLLVEEGIKPALVFTIPSHHNPTSVCLSADRRKKLIQLADDYGFYILADEAYQLLGFPEAPKNIALADEDNTENGVVFTIGTFSKIFAPAIRLGWVQAHAKLIQKLLTHPMLLSGGGMNSVMAGWVEPLLKTGEMSKYLAYLRQELFVRYQHLSTSIKKYLPEIEIINAPDGGYFLWGRVPKEIDTAALNDFATDKYNVRFRPGVKCNTSSEYLRFCFAFHTPEEIDKGVTLLAAAYQEYRQTLNH